MKLNDILEFEDIKIIEKRYNIVELSNVDFCNLESADDFHLNNYDLDGNFINYDDTIIKYRIYKGFKVIGDEMSEKEVRDFLKELEEKY